MATTVDLVSGFVSHDGRHICLQFESNTVPTRYAFPDWKDGLAAGKKIRLSNGAWLSFVNIDVDNGVAVKNFVQSSTASQTVLGSYYDGGAGHHAGKNLRIVAGTGAGQTRVISTYNLDDLTHPYAIVDTNWSVTPDTTSIYEIYTVDKFTWKVWLEICEPQQVITKGQSITATVNAGLFTDKFGNTHSGGTVTLTNYSIVDKTGFSTSFDVDPSGIVLYVAPGLSEASDSYNVTQAQNIATPLNSLRQAVLHLYNNGYFGTGSRIKILKGTTDEVNTINYMGGLNGPSWTYPFILESYWYSYPSGGGNSGRRPKISFGKTIGYGLVFQGNSTHQQYVLVRGIEVSSSNTGRVDSGISVSIDGWYSHLVFEDCDFNGGTIGVNLNVVDDYQNSQESRFITFTRCIVRNTTDIGNSHTQGFLTGGAVDSVISQCVVNACAKKNLDFSATDSFSHAMYLNTYPVLVSMCAINDNGSHGVQNRGGGAIYKTLMTKNGIGAFIAGKGGRMALNHLGKGHDLGWGWVSGVYNEANKSITKINNFNRYTKNVGDTVFITQGTNAKIGSYTTIADTVKTVITGVSFAYPNPRLELSGAFASYVHNDANKVLVSGAGATYGYYNISSGNSNALYLSNAFFSDPASLGSSGLTNLTISLDNDGIILADSINAGANGSQDVCGYILTSPLGWGLQVIGEVPYCCIELNTAANTSGTGGRAMYIHGTESYLYNTDRQSHVLIRNNTCLNYSTLYIQYPSDSLEVYRNVFDQNAPSDLTYPEVIDMVNITGYTFYSGHDNIYIGASGKADKFVYTDGGYLSFAGFKALSSSETNSLENSGVNINYQDRVPTLEKYYQSIQFNKEQVLNSFANRLSTRPPGVWDSSYDTWPLIQYMMKQLNHNIAASGTGLLNYYGAGTSDPTEMGGNRYSANIGIVGRVPLIVKTKAIT